MSVQPSCKHLDARQLGLAIRLSPLREALRARREVSATNRSVGQRAGWNVRSYTKRPFIADPIKRSEISLSNIGG